MSIEFKVFPIATESSRTFRISSPFDPNRFHPTLNIVRPHKGADIPATQGTPLLSVDTGEVTYAQPNVVNGAGKYVNIKYDGYSVRYLHMSSVAVQAGMKVAPGMIIGRVGNTGITPNGTPISTGPHLHFELYDSNNKAIDPSPFLSRAAQQTTTPFLPRVASTNGGVPATEATRPSARYVGSGTGVSPYIATLDSFHPNIQYELTRRRLGSETINSHMPFVKLTALLKVSGKNLADKSSESLDEYCPTLGVHGQPEISFDDMYLPRENKSIIGYATRMGTNGPERVPVLVEDEDYDAPNIPIPGILSMTAERSTAGPMGVRGGLYRANMKVIAYSVGQLNALLTYFLRPATKVVLEVGRLSSSPNEPSVADIESKDLFFNWKRPLDAIKTDLEEIAMFRGDQKGLINKYTYNNFGNYELLVGYITDFKLKYGAKNTYEVDLTMQSLQQFEVPLKNTGTKSLCRAEAINDESKAIDIDEYFSDGANWKRNTISKLLSLVTSDQPGEMSDWKPHIIKMRGAGTDNPDADGYLVTWRFFVDVILNDEKHGLLSIFDLTNADERNTLEFMRKALLSRYTPEALVEAPNKIIDGQVAWHSSLRSVDPNVMVIYNKAAQQLARVVTSISEANTRNTLSDELTNNVLNSITADYDDIGPFEEISQGLSSLYTGVWLNLNAIIKAFSSADTVSMALSNLLKEMNNATEGVWNLQLISTENGVYVIDMGVSKPNNQPVMRDSDVLMNSSLDRREEELRLLRGDTPDSPKYIYKFNRKLKTFAATDETLGGELTDISIQSGLPHVVAVQAIGGVSGLGQRGTLAAINVDELKLLSLFDTTPTCSDKPKPTAAGGPPSALISGELESQLMSYAREAFREGKKKIDSTTVNAIVVSGIATGYIPAGTGSVAFVEIERLINEKIQMLDEEYAQRMSGLISLVKTYANSFGRALEMIEWNRAAMLKEIENTSDDGKKIHPFNSSNLTKTIVDLTMPGIGGIQLFQGFEVDRVPSFLNQGYYVVTKVSHNFSTQGGWTTKIQGRFRYKANETD